MIKQELRTNVDTRRPQKSQLSARASELMTSRPNDVKLKERLDEFEVDWSELESSLDNCQQLLVTTETVLLPSTQAASELTVWMDTVDQTIEVKSDLQPRNADDMLQLHNDFKVLMSLLR